MTRKQDLIAAFAVAIRELGLRELKNTTLFSSGHKQCAVEDERKAA